MYIPAFYKSERRKKEKEISRKVISCYTVCQGDGVRGQGLMTHSVDVEACWHGVQPGTGTARERGVKWMQPAIHTHTEEP